VTSLDEGHGLLGQAGAPTQISLRQRPSSPQGAADPAL